MAYALWEDSPYRKSQDDSIFDGGFADWARQQGCPDPDEADWHMLRLREKDDGSESASESDTSSEAGPESDE